MSLKWQILKITIMKLLLKMLKIQHVTYKKHLAAISPQAVYKNTY